MSTVVAPVPEDAVHRRAVVRVIERLLAREWVWYWLVAFVTVLFEALALRLWRADLAVPLTNNSDATSSIELAKGALDTWWYFTNHAVGAPIGQELYDYPFGGDNLNMALLDVLVHVTRDNVVGTNLFYLLGFPLEAIAAFFCMRSWGVSRLGSGVGGVLFALVPYHFYRAEGHLMLSGYYAVPLGAYLAVACARGEPIWSGRRRYGTAALCVVIASTGLYYAVFTMLLVVVALVLEFLRRRERRALIGGIAVLAAIVAVSVANDLPNLVYVHEHGRAVGVAVRTPIESEIYGLRLAPTVMPDPSHRLGPLAQIGVDYWKTHGYGVTSPEGEPIGLTASIGLLLLVFALLAAVVRPRAGPASLLALLGVFATTLFLVATTSGLGTVFAYVVTAQIRGWARAAIVLAFFGIAAVMVVLDGVLGRSRRFATWPARTAVFGLVLCLGVLDQTNNSYIPPHSILGPSWHSAASYVRTIEHTLPRGSMIYQVPYMPYPESPAIVNMYSYDPFVGYLHSHDLRWSYGAMRGTSADWSSAIASEPMARQLIRVSSAGFAAVWVDRNGYADHGAAVEAEIAKLTRARPLVDSSDRWSTYSLLGLRARLRQRVGSKALDAVGTATVRPPKLSWSGFFAQESADADTWRWSKTNTPRLTLHGWGGRGQVADLTATVSAASTKPTHLVVSDAGHRLGRLTIPPGGATRLALRVTVPRGGTTLDLVTDAPPASPGGDTRVLFVRLQNVQYLPRGTAAALKRLLAGH